MVGSRARGSGGCPASARVTAIAPLARCGLQSHPRRRASDIFPLEAVRPDLHAVGSVDQSNIDDGARSLAPDPASYDVSNSELVPDRGGIDAPRSVSEGGLVRGHPEPTKSGKGVVEIFGQGAGEVSNCRIGAVAARNRQQETGTAPLDSTIAVRRDIALSDVADNAFEFQAMTTRAGRDSQAAIHKPATASAATDRGVARAAARIEVGRLDRRLSTGASASASIDAVIDGRSGSVLGPIAASSDPELAPV